MEEGENDKVRINVNNLKLSLKIRYGAVGMQGWRRTMEDAHIASLDIGDGISVFGVLDGHGGNKLFVPNSSNLNIGHEVA